MFEWQVEAQFKNVSADDRVYIGIEGDSKLELRVCVCVCVCVRACVHVCARALCLLRVSLPSPSLFVCALVCGWVGAGRWLIVGWWVAR